MGIVLFGRGVEAGSGAIEIAQVPSSSVVGNTFTFSPWFFRVVLLCLHTWYYSVYKCK